MIIHDCANFEDLLRLVRERYFALQRGQWVFRGQADARHRLIPSVGRIDHVSATRDKAERSLLSIFQRSAVQHLERIPASNWQWLALAQHHRLPTRMLDWSFNPSVALYFTVSELPDVVGRLYALHAPFKIGDEEMRRTDPLDIQRPVKYFPEVVTPRVAAQEGLFTLHAQTDEPLEDQLPDKWQLEAITVRAEQKSSFRYLLFRHGIHEASLFPSLDGLARHVSWQHTVSPAKSLGV